MSPDVNKNKGVAETDPLSVIGENLALLLIGDTISIDITDLREKKQQQQTNKQQRQNKNIVRYKVISRWWKRFK